MNDLFAEMLSVTSALEAAGICYALVGGLAYSLYVETRATEDIDLLISESDWPAVGDLLRPLGFESIAAPMDFPTVRIRRLTKISDGCVLVLDFLLAEGQILEGLSRRNGLQVRQQTIFVAPPETIIKLKEQRLSDKDKSDIAGLKKLLEDRKQ